MALRILGEKRKMKAASILAAFVSSALSLAAASAAEPVVGDGIAPTKAGHIG